MAAANGAMPGSPLGQLLLERLNTNTTGGGGGTGAEGAAANGEDEILYGGMASGSKSRK